MTAEYPTLAGQAHSSSYWLLISTSAFSLLRSYGARKDDRGPGIFQYAILVYVISDSTHQTSIVLQHLSRTGGCQPGSGRDSGVDWFLNGTCRRVSELDATALDEAAFTAVRTRDRTILTQSIRELPKTLARLDGQRGRIAKSNAEVLRFARDRDRDPDTPFTNTRSERDICMDKVKQTVSGCFRTLRHAQAHCRISSSLQSMAHQGYNPLTAIQIALNGTAATMIKQERGASSYGFFCIRKSQP